MKTKLLIQSLLFILLIGLNANGEQVDNYQEYEQLYKELGMLAPISLKVAHLRKFLKDSDVKTIDIEKLTSDLNKTCILSKLIPLRESDNISIWMLPNGQICLARRIPTYSKELSLSSLKLISKIHQRFPDAKFLIGDWPWYSSHLILCVLFEGSQPTYIVL